MAFTHPSHTSDQAFAILAIAFCAIVGTAFLIVGYYVIFHTCCSQRHQLHLPSWFITTSPAESDSFIALSPDIRNRGLDRSAIRKIPMIQYRVDRDRSTSACVVCLNEFEEKDVLRRLPKCSHAFHLDCIDVWLQGNAKCPLCRSSISGSTKYPFHDKIVAPTSSPQGSHPFSDSFAGDDDDFVVIELRGQREQVLVPNRLRESDSSGLVQEQFRSQLSMKALEKKKGRQHFPIMGDEFVDVRGKDDQFSIQPIRRSFSFDSAVDQQIYLGVQRCIQSQRSFIPFVNGRGSSRIVPSSEVEP
ncbi:hypothetical protein K2173_018465 [Erythroxylum novogranatense]|uniref:RING-type E3 ubiquitin transferase n=1 Tax=Erythroxylum novogranatense TaxID=1862640 RepID=A0AAV8UDD2_9ROSI|nr:hypothetical protein K2173_018465 [Erythroxylum novogranatense]